MTTLGPTRSRLEAGTTTKPSRIASELGRPRASTRFEPRTATRTARLYIYARQQRRPERTSIRCGSRACQKRRPDASGRDVTAALRRRHSAGQQGSRDRPSWPSIGRALHPHCSRRTNIAPTAFKNDQEKRYCHHEPLLVSFFPIFRSPLSRALPRLFRRNREDRPENSDLLLWPPWNFPFRNAPAESG